MAQQHPLPCLSGDRLLQSVDRAVEQTAAPRRGIACMQGQLDSDDIAPAGEVPPDLTPLTCGAAEP